MGCKITFHLNGKSITYTSKYNSEEELTLEAIVKELLSDNSMKFLVDGKEQEGNFMVTLQSLLKNRKNTKRSNKDFRKQLNKFIDEHNGESIVGNYTLKDLSIKYPSLNFEGLDDYLEDDEEIIYLPNLKYNGIGLGGALTLNNRIYHILSNYYDVKAFIYNLNLRKKLNELQNDQDKLDNYIKENHSLQTALDFIKENDGVKKNLTALQNFFKHSDKYLYSIKDGVDIYATVSNCLKDLFYDKINRKQLNNLLINSIYQRSTLNSRFEYVLPLRDIFNLCKNIDDPIANKILEIDKSKDISEGDKLEKIKLEISELFDNEDITVNVYIYNNNLYFTKPYVSFDDFDYTERQLNLALKIFSKFGLNCFEFQEKGKSTFFVSNDNILTADSYAGNKFNTLEEAKKYIENKLKYQSVFKGFSIEKYHLNPGQDLHFQAITQYFKPKKHSTFDVYEYVMPNEGTIFQQIDEKYRKYLNYNIQDAIDALSKELNYDLSTINNYDKFVILLLELSNGRSITEAITKINQLKFTRYFVVDSSTLKNGKHKLKLSEVTPGITSDDNDDTPSSPTIIYLTNLAEIINRKFKLNNNTDQNIIEIITNDDLTDNMPKNVKGFIQNGVIKINASKAGYDDLVHEFSHLFLGMLKAYDFDTYTQLLEKSENDIKLITLKLKLKQNEVYKNLSDSDLTEEAFVRLFSRDILQTTKKLSVLENEINSKFEEAMDKFKVNITGASTLSDLFKSFNSALTISLMQGNGLELNAMAAKQRQVVNVIKDKLGKEIIENC